MLRSLPLLGTLLLASATVHAQTAPAAVVIDSSRATDVASPEAVVTALYDVISGPAGQARDWTRFRSLFAPGAKMAAIGRRPDGSAGRRVMTPEDYITLSGPFLVKEGFIEKELARRVERFGELVHVWTTYEGKVSSGAMPPMRGINSIQLVSDGKRWYVLNITWQAESPGLTLPAEYLLKQR